MKITKYPSSNPDKFEINRIAANANCDVCPCCGENKKFYVDNKSGKLKGISGGFMRTWYEGFFKTRAMRVDCYSCFTCGAKWESEPYEWC